MGVGHGSVSEIHPNWTNKIIVSVNMKLMGEKTDSFCGYFKINKTTSPLQNEA